MQNLIILKPGIYNVFSNIISCKSSSRKLLCRALIQKFFNIRKRDVCYTPAFTQMKFLNQHHPGKVHRTFEEGDPLLFTTLSKLSQKCRPPVHLMHPSAQLGSTFANPILQKMKSS